MLRSLNSAVTGLKSMQTSMDVIANNIANVDTNGYKSSSTSFSDMFYQTINGGTATTNPSQVGYGTKVSSVNKNMENVGATETDRATDLYIDGDGFFVLNTSRDGSGTTLYSRVGNFSVNSEGYLVDSNGNYVMSEVKNADGTYSEGNAINLKSENSLITLQTEDGDIIPVDSANYSDLSDITFNADGTVTATYGDYTGTLHTATVAGVTDYTKLTGVTYSGGAYAGSINGAAVGPLTVTDRGELTVALASFANPDGLSEQGNCTFAATKSSGTASYFQADTNNSIMLRSGYLEMSNVDLATEFTRMITTQRAYQANSRVITVSDSMLEELVNLKRS